ncbi:hypothetical protein QT971_13905 [Microcoleus sp. herbarium19]
MRVESRYLHRNVCPKRAIGQSYLLNITDLGEGSSATDYVTDLTDLTD